MSAKSRLTTQSFVRVLFAAAFAIAVGSGFSAFAASQSQAPINEHEKLVNAPMPNIAENDQKDTRTGTASSVMTKDDPILQKDYRAYLAYQVAEDAKQHLIDWAKWIVGVVALMIAILGIKTYFDVQNKINAAIEAEIVTARAKTTDALEKFRAGTAAALTNLHAETDRASALISEQTSQASAKIALIVGGLPPYIASPAVSGLTRTIYDAQHKGELPGKLVRKEGDAPSSDPVVNEVYNNIGVTYQFLKSVFSLQLAPSDHKVIVSVHYQDKFNNSFWNGEQIVLGDGDGKIFASFADLDIVCAELCLPIIQGKTKLPFQGAQGALLNHLRDTFAVMAVQWQEKQPAADASWLIGSNAFAPGFKATALRSMRAPGTAYDNDVLGKDPQPDHMKNYVKTEEDNGGSHINCGILNHAFYLAAIEIAGFSWEKAGTIWMKSLDHVTQSTDFVGFANITVNTSRELFGNRSHEASAVAKAWSGVGIDVHLTPVEKLSERTRPKRTRISQPGTRK